MCGNTGHTTPVRTGPCMPRVDQGQHLLQFLHLWPVVWSWRTSSQFGCVVARFFLCLLLTCPFFFLPVS